jgi:antitoxin component YwqK of YwqJK toxin-antitoxin module
MGQEWYWTRDGKSRNGPVASAELQALAKSGQLLPTDMILKSGQAKWVPASKIKGLFPPQSAIMASRSQPVPQPPPPPPLEPANQETVQTPAARPWYRRTGFPPWMRMALAGIIVLAGLGRLAQLSKKSDTRGESASRTGTAMTESDVKVHHEQLPHVTPNLAQVTASQLRPGNKGDHKDGGGARAGTPDDRSKARPVGGDAPGPVAGSPSEVDTPDFSKVNYAYDFSKDDYVSIPAGAKRHIQNRVEKSPNKTIDGKPETDEGYIDAIGKFIDHGSFITWTDDRQTKKVREGKMLHGKLHGVMVYYHPNGKKSDEAPFVRDKLHGIQRWWYENGQLAREVPYIDGKKHGTEKGWYDGGEREFENSWVHSKQHGPSKRWYKDGKPEQVTHWRDGLLHGPYVTYSKDYKAFEGLIPSFEVCKGRVENGRPAGTWRFGFISETRKVYFVEVTAGRWIGGTCREFLTRMRCEAMTAETASPFDPAAGIGSLVVNSQNDFFGVFGFPERDDPHPEVLTQPPHIQRYVRRWIYRCADGTVTLKAQFSAQSGKVVVTAGR